jgi:hypothetical protein
MSIVDRVREHPSLPSFIEQEQSNEGRGVATCYPTSVVNSAIGMGLISRKDALIVIDRIVDDMVAIPRLWSDGKLRLDFGNEYIIAAILEAHLPVKIGVEPFDTNSREIREAVSIDSIVHDLSQKRRTFVILDRRRAHCYSLVPYGQSIGYVDANYPDERCIITRSEHMKSLFHGYSDGRFNTTPITPYSKPRAHWFKLWR